MHPRLYHIQLSPKLKRVFRAHFRRMYILDLGGLTSLQQHGIAHTYESEHTSNMGVSRRWESSLEECNVSHVETNHFLTEFSKLILLKD